MCIRDRPYALDYTRITAVGMPFLIITNGISNLARADGSPKYSMTCMLVGAIINTILDPIFIFIFHMGVTGAAIATVTGQFFSCLMALRYIPKFQQVKLKKSHFGVHISQWGANVTLGPVSYTHLDVYKRQGHPSISRYIHLPLAYSGAV